MLITVLASLTLAAQQAPLDPAVEADIACVASLSALASSFPKEQQGSVAPLVTYYVGRLDGRVPGLDLEQALIRQLKGKTQAELATYMQSNGKRCSNEMIALGTRLQAVGKSLAEQGK